MTDTPHLHDIAAGRRTLADLSIDGAIDFIGALGRLLDGIDNRAAARMCGAYQRLEDMDWTDGSIDVGDVVEGNTGCDDEDIRRLAAAVVAAR